MYCKNCGIQIDDDSKFCIRCGTKQTLGIVNEITKSTIISHSIQDIAPEIKKQPNDNDDITVPLIPE